MDFTSSTFFAQFVFLITGVISTIGYQFVYYSGAAGKSTLLPVAANYYGMALSYFLPKERNAKPLREMDWSYHAQVLCLALLEIAGNTCSVLGIIYAGSGIYQVIYSSVVIFTALWSRIFLHRVLTTQHWQAIIIVTLGLSISTLGGSTNSSEEENSVGLFMLGAFFTLCATMMYSFHYVLSEKILTQKNPPTPQQLQTSAGVYVAALISIYLLCWTIPNFQELVVESVIEHDGHPQLIVFSYIILILSGFGHSVTFFKLMGSVGAVSTGILQSLRAVSVFVISALLFCEVHANQCFTAYKGLSTVVVITGILYFSKASAIPKKVDLIINEE